MYEIIEKEQWEVLSPRFLEPSAVTVFFASFQKEKKLKKKIKQRVGVEDLMIYH